MQRRSTSRSWFVRSTCRRASRRSVSVAWSHDEPHDQSDQDEQQHAHSKPSERTHSVSKATHHGELLLLLPGSSGTPPVSHPGAAFAARNHRETMKSAGHGQPGRGGANRDGQVHVCPFGGSVLESHHGDKVALLRSLGVRGGEGIGSGDTRSTQLTRAHLGRLNAQANTRDVLPPRRRDRAPRTWRCWRTRTCSRGGSRRLAAPENASPASHQRCGHVAEIRTSRGDGQRWSVGEPQP